MRQVLHDRIEELEEMPYAVQRLGQALDDNPEIEEFRLLLRDSSLSSRAIPQTSCRAGAGNLHRTISGISA